MITEYPYVQDSQLVSGYTDVTALVSGGSSLWFYYYETAQNFEHRIPICHSGTLGEFTSKKTWWHYLRTNAFTIWPILVSTKSGWRVLIDKTVSKSMSLLQTGTIISFFVFLSYFQLFEDRVWGMLTFNTEPFLDYISRVACQIQNRDVPITQQTPYCTLSCPHWISSQPSA